MQQTSDTNVPPKYSRVFWIFYNTAIFLLLAAIAITFVQKSYESAAKITLAKTLAQGGNVQDVPQVPQLYQNAVYWAKVSFATVALAMLSLGVAVWHYEKQRWVWGIVIILLFFFVAFQLIMV